VTLATEVEGDEASVGAGHKGPPEGVTSKDRKGRRRRRHGPAGRGTLAKEKPPVFGRRQRGGHVVITLLAQVQPKTIEPFSTDTLEPGTRVYTAAYSMDARWCAWGYDHKSVNHGWGAYARDDDGDGVCAVHVHTMAGCWSLVRSWLRPHRGIAQEQRPLSLGFFACVHNVRKRGKALLGALMAWLVCEAPRIQ
jgi:transposase